MSYKTEFPDFGQLNIIIQCGFTDASDKNDCMPKFKKKLPNGSNLILWVDYLDKSKSATPNSPRYRLSVMNDQHIRLHDDILIEKWIEVTITITGLEEYHSVQRSHKK